MKKVRLIELWKKDCVDCENVRSVVNELEEEIVKLATGERKRGDKHA